MQDGGLGSHMVNGRLLRPEALRSSSKHPTKFIASPGLASKWTLEEESERRLLRFSGLINSDNNSLFDASRE